MGKRTTYFFFQNQGQQLAQHLSEGKVILTYLLINDHPIDSYYFLNAK